MNSLLQLRSTLQMDNQFCCCNGIHIDV